MVTRATCCTYHFAFLGSFNRWAVAAGTLRLLTCSDRDWSPLLESLIGLLGRERRDNVISEPPKSSRARDAALLGSMLLVWVLQCLQFVSKCCCSPPLANVVLPPTALLSVHRAGTSSRATGDLALWGGGFWWKSLILFEIMCFPY